MRKSRSDAQTAAVNRRYATREFGLSVCRGLKPAVTIVPSLRDERRRRVTNRADHEPESCNLQPPLTRHARAASLDQRVPATGIGGPSERLKGPLYRSSLTRKNN